MDWKDMNKVYNWPLRVREERPYKNGNGATLNAMLSGIKKKDATDTEKAVYAKSMFVSVLCNSNTSGDGGAVGETSTVSGSFMVDDYVAKDGSKRHSFKIFASSVDKGMPQCDKSDWTICENWALYCVEQKASNNGKVELRCRMSGAKKKDTSGQPILGEDGKPTYAMPMTVVVICDPEKTTTDMANFEKQNLLVTGKMVVDEEETPDGTAPVYKLFAFSVGVRQ